MRALRLATRTRSQERISYRDFVGQREHFHEHALAVAPLAAAKKLAERPHPVLTVHDAVAAHRQRTCTHKEVDNIYTMPF